MYTRTAEEGVVEEGLPKLQLDKKYWMWADQVRSKHSRQRDTQHHVSPLDR